MGNARAGYNIKKGDREGLPEKVIWQTTGPQTEKCDFCTLSRQRFKKPSVKGQVLLVNHL